MKHFVLNKYLLIVILLVCVVIIPRLFLKDSNTDINEPTTSISVCDGVLENTALAPVKIFLGTPAKVNFSKDEWLIRFHTTVSEQVAKGPNFAGHFTFAYWGCGTSCISYVIIDSITGNRVLVSSSEVIENLSPSYDINSRLLVFNSKKGYEYLRGKTLEEITAIDPADNPSQRGREYFELVEESDGHVWLNKICTENALDGIYKY